MSGTVHVLYHFILRITGKWIRLSPSILQMKGPSLKVCVIVPSEVADSDFLPYCLSVISPLAIIANITIIDLLREKRCSVFEIQRNWPL